MPHARDTGKAAILLFAHVSTENNGFIGLESGFLRNFIRVYAGRALAGRHVEGFMQAGLMQVGFMFGHSFRKVNAAWLCPNECGSKVSHQGNYEDTSTEEKKGTGDMGERQNVKPQHATQQRLRGWIRPAAPALTRKTARQTQASGGRYRHPTGTDIGANQNRG